MDTSLLILLLTTDDDLETSVCLALRNLSGNYSLRRLAAAADIFSGLAEGGARSTQGDVPPALLLLDCSFPDPPAIELLARLRAQASHLPIIALVADGEDESGVAAFRAGATDYVVKSPQRLHRLPVAIESALYRIRLVDNLCASENQLRQLMAQSPVPIEICDPDGTAIAVNEAFLQMFGIPSAEAVVGHYNVFKDPVVEQLGLLPSIRRVYSGEVVHLPQVHVPAGLVATHYSPARNDQVIQSVTMFPVLTETGEIQQVITIWQDITERVRAQGTSCLAEASYRSLVENATDAIIAAEGEKITLWNLAAETMFGYSAAEAIGQPLTLIIPETHRKQHIQGLTHFFKTTEAEAIGHIYEVEGLRKDGSQFPVEISVAAQKLEERYRFTAVLRDITARRQAEATLAALNAAALAAQQARTPDEVYAAVGDALRDLGLNLVVVAPDPADEHLVIRYAVFQADQARVLEKALGQAVQKLKFPLASLPAYSTYWQSGQAEFRRDLLTYVKGRAARKLARAGLKALGNPACIDAPFTDESGVTGALIVFGADLSARDVPTMDLFARQMSAALERTRLHQETTRLANALTGLFQCSQELTVSQTPQAIFATLFRYIQGIFGFSIGSLALYDSDAQSLRFIAIEGKEPPPDWPACRMLSEYPADWVEAAVTQPRPLIIELDSVPELHHLLIAPEQKTLVILPVFYADRPVGIVTLSSRTRLTLSETDQDLLTTFANQTVAALENTRLYTETRSTRDYYNTLLNSLHDQILIINRDYVITDVNEPLVCKTGYTREQIIGRYCYEFSHRLDSPCWEQADHLCPIVEVWQTGRSSQATHVHYDVAGKPTYVHIAASPLFSEEGQVIGAIEACHDVTAEKRLEGRLKAIYQLGQELTLLRDEAAIIQRVLEMAVGVLQFEVAICGLVNEAAGVLDYRYLVGASPLALSLPLNGERGIGVAVVRSGEAINVPDTAQDARYIPGDWPARSELCVPMKLKERVIGVLNAESAEPDYFTPDDRQLLQTLADQAVVALQNAWLFNELRQRATQLQTAAEVSRAATSVLELDQLLSQVVELIRERFDLYYVGLFLIDEVGEWAVLRASTGKAGQIQLERGHRLKVGGESMVGWCVANTQTRIALDVGREAVRFDNPLLPDTRSEMALPLICRGRTIGALTVQSTHPAAFSQADITALQTMADQLANAIENARLYEAERVRHREAEALRRAALALTSTITLNQVFDRILAELQSVVPYDSASVQLLKEDELEIIGGRGFPNLSELLGISFPSGDDNPNALVLESRDSVIVDDARLHYPAFNREPHAAANIRSWMGVPLLIGDRVIGMLTLDKQEPGFYTRIHARAAKAYAAQAAIAIENARLYEEIRQRANELAAIHQVAQAVGGTLDIETVLTATLETTLAASGVEIGAVHRWEDTTETLGLVAQRGLPDWFVAEIVHLSPADGVSGLALTQRQVLVGNLSSDIPAAARRRFEQAGIQSFASIPLLAKEQGHGILNLGSRRADAFSNRHLNLLSAIGQQVGLALENARLYEDLQAQVVASQQAQARLVQSEKLAAIGELVAGVAHELNNPLTSITGFAQLLKHNQVNEDMGRDLEKIIAEARRAAHIVRSLLDFARQRPPERKPVQINDMLNSTLDLLAYELRTHNITWTTHFLPNLPLTMADPQQLQQVFINLIHNARQAMSAAHGSGHLTITSKLESSAFTNHQPGAAPCICIIIQDDGPGIPPNVMPRIFDPFFTTKPEGEGTGLGLSVCHGIVSEHGGHIWAESKSGQGTSFFIELPVVAPEVPGRVSKVDPVKKSVPAGTARILMIDDEVNVLEVLARALERKGYQVDAVSNGETALARLAETDYDLIVCDVRMPGLSGQEVYQQVQGQDPDLAKRIIFTTGDTISPDTRRFLEETGVPCLSKPFELDDIIKTVREATSRR